MILFCTPLGHTKKFPWQRRVGKNLIVRHKLSYKKMHPGLWPKEPESPEIIDSARFKSAIGTLCGQMPKNRLQTYTETILDVSKQVAIDPFLLGALMYTQSGCRPKTPEKETRHGLTRIDLKMHAPHIRGGEYRYYRLENGEWQLHTLSLHGNRYNQWSLEKPAVHLRIAAHLLAVFKKQCADLDRAVGGIPHRHFVSHFFFGDKVRHTESEDAVLTARRRLIGYYDRRTPPPTGTFKNVPIHMPLDGGHRLLLDYFGNKRGKKHSAGHQGIDLAGISGEPVRAVAPGRVTFAGVDLKKPHPSRQTTPEAALEIPASTLGAGGLYVIVNHENGLRTCYMHLTTLGVTHGQTVSAGDTIGTLGNTGTTSSGPHLHLEFRLKNGERVDPAPYFALLLVNPFK